MKNVAGIQADLAEMSADYVRAAGSHSHQAGRKENFNQIATPKLMIGCTVLL